VQDFPQTMLKTLAKPEPSVARLSEKDMIQSRHGNCFNQSATHRPGT
jgi:hypothetical protein